MDNFDRDLERGKRGEAIVAAALTARNHKVIDMSDNWDYRRKDIDFIVENEKQQAKTTLEVKNDMRSEDTGNLFIETYNSHNESHSYLGWFFYCSAEYICFLQEHKRKAHIVSFGDLQKQIGEKAYRIGGSINAKGYLLPLEDLKGLPSYTCLEVG